MRSCPKFAPPPPYFVNRKVFYAFLTCSYHGVGVETTLSGVLIEMTAAFSRSIEILSVLELKSTMKYLGVRLITRNGPVYGRVKGFRTLSSLT